MLREKQKVPLVEKQNWNIRGADLFWSECHGPGNAETGWLLLAEPVTVLRAEICGNKGRMGISEAFSGLRNLGNYFNP